MRMLELQVKGYRSLKDICWQPGALNILIGPNGSGKSNLLRMLELISVSAKGQLGKCVQRAGGMEPLVWDGKAPCIEFAVKTSDVSEAGDAEKLRLTYQMMLERIGKTSSYRIGHELLATCQADNTPVSSCEVPGLARIPLLFRRRGLRSEWLAENGDTVAVSLEGEQEEESFLSLASAFFARDLVPAPFKVYLASWSIYHDVQVNLDAPIRQSTVARHETRVDPDGQNLISVLHTLYTGDRDFKNDINLAMRAAFGDDFDELVFPPAADQRIQMRVRWKSLKREQSAADLSDGTLRFLFLLAVLASPSPAPLIAIDEPEVGLHPSMFPIIAEYAVDAAERTQVILTTHSPQFLDAFGETPPQTTVVKWSDGETLLAEIEGERLRRWLEEYSLGALFHSGELENALT